MTDTQIEIKNSVVGSVSVDQAGEAIARLLAERQKDGHILDASPEELADLVAVAAPVLENQPGMKFDGEKPRWDLLPFKAISSVVDVLTYGARKYKAWNWIRVENGRDRYFAAALRHLVAYRSGELPDPETGFPHLAHAACCILFMLGLDLGETEPFEGVQVRG